LPCAYTGQASAVPPDNRQSLRAAFPYRHRVYSIVEINRQPVHFADWQSFLNAVQPNAVAALAGSAPAIAGSSKNRRHTTRTTE
jgi:hypothetical protein